MDTNKAAHEYAKLGIVCRWRIRTSEPATSKTKPLRGGAPSHILLRESGGEGGNLTLEGSPPTSGGEIPLLRALLRLYPTALRDGKPVSLPVARLVPGDLVRLAPGSVVPADGRLLEANGLHVNASNSN